MSRSHHVVIVKWLFGFALGWGVAGLAQAQDYGAFWSKNKPERGKPFGCLAGSLGRSSSNSLSGLQVRMFLIREGVSQRNQIATQLFLEGAWNKTANVIDGDERRETFHFCLRPGRYTLLGFGISDMSYYYNPKKDWDVVIEVLPGETTYIGSFTGFLSGQPSRCPEIPSTLRIEMRSDRQAQDMVFVQPLADKAKHRVVTRLPDLSAFRPALYICQPEKQESRG